MGYQPGFDVGLYAGSWIQSAVAFAGKSCLYKWRTKDRGMGGFPLGDLYHWWNPAVREGSTDYYSAWKAQAEAERTRIAGWLESGTDPLSGVKRLPGTVVPAQYTLGQNYPNPFNPTTNIQYSVPVSGHVSIRIFNAIGQEVATLYDGIQQAGNYLATFDGSQLAGGVYLYRLQSGTASITKKLVLTK